MENYIHTSVSAINTFLKKNNQKLLLLFIIPFLSLFHSQCDQSSLFCTTSHFSHFWNYHDTLILTMNVPDTHQTYELILYLDILPSYPYQNLYLRFEMFHNQAFLSEATPNFLLFDPYGKPYGKTHWFSKTISYRFILKNKLQFPFSGTYTLRLQQWMRTDSLPAIQKVSLCLKPKP